MIDTANDIPNNLNQIESIIKQDEYTKDIIILDGLYLLKYHPKYTTNIEYIEASNFIENDSYNYFTKDTLFMWIIYSFMDWNKSNMSIYDNITNAFTEYNIPLKYVTIITNHVLNMYATTMKLINKYIKDIQNVSNLDVFDLDDFNKFYVLSNSGLFNVDNREKLIITIHVYERITNE